MIKIEILIKIKKNYDKGNKSTQIEYDTSRPTGCYYWKGNNGTGVRYNRFLDTKRNAEASLFCQNGKNEFCKKTWANSSYIYGKYVAVSFGKFFFNRKENTMSSHKELLRCFSLGALKGYSFGKFISRKNTPP